MAGRAVEPSFLPFFFILLLNPVNPVLKIAGGQRQVFEGQVAFGGGDSHRLKLGTSFDAEIAMRLRAACPDTPAAEKRLSVRSIGLRMIPDLPCHVTLMKLRADYTSVAK